MKKELLFILCSAVMFILNALGKLFFDINPLSTEACLIVAFFVTWCNFKDEK